MTDRLSDERVAELQSVNSEGGILYEADDLSYVPSEDVHALALEVQQARKVLAFLREIVTIRAGHSRTAAIVLDVLDHQARVK